MKFKKGEINNPKGRTVGAVGKKTVLWNEIGEWFATEGIETYKENLIQLMTSEDIDTKLKAMDKFNALIEFFKPKLARTEVVKEKEETVVTVKWSKD